MDEATTAGAMGRVPTPAAALALCGAALNLLATGLEMEEATTAAAFGSTADTVYRAEADGCTQRPCLASSTRASRWKR